MKTVTAQELKDEDPKRFEREYYKWLEYAHDYDWWDWLEEAFTADMKEVGVRVERIFFSLSYSQGDRAGFSGRVDVASWMANNKYSKDETYAEAFPALYIAVVQDGSYAVVSESHRSRCCVDYCSSVEYTDPEGVFQFLDDEAWHDLLTDQELAADLEANIVEWVNNKSHDLYRQLRNEYESISSEAAFIESCDCNEVEFEIETEEHEGAQDEVHG